MLERIPEVQVANLADPAMLVEIEAEAYAPSEK